MLTFLGLVMRGLRWRWVSSVAVALVAVVAMVGAVLGPLYASSAADSLVREGMAEAAPVSTGVLVRAQRATQEQFTPRELLDAVAERAADPALDPWYQPGTLALTVGSGAPRVRDNPIGVGMIGWHRGQCDAVEITSGECPSGRGEAMITARMADQFDIALGDSLRLGISSDLATDQVEVVGIFDADTADPRVWGLVSPAQFVPSQIPDGPDRLDEIVVDEETFLDGSGDVGATSFRALDASTVHASDLPELLAAVESVAAIPVAAGTGPRTVASFGLPTFLDGLAPDLDDVAAAAFAVTAALVLLAWFALFLVVSATSEERSGEVALAKLRGMDARSTFMFGLAEPLLILVVAVPVGLAAAYAINVFITGRVMAPGTDTSISEAALLALAAGFLGGVVAAMLASRRVLTAPVVEQLRRTGGRRARLARSVAVDAFAIALLAAGIYQLRRGGTDVLALLTPSLIALTMGLLAVRVVPRLARLEVARTRGTSRVAAFVASSNIARRPSGLRTIILLSLAVGLTVFAVDGWAVASANRDAVAPAQVGGWQVLHVRSYSPGSLLTAVRAADPTGTQALAAVATTSGAIDGGLIAVDASRIGAVAAWDPAWAGTSREAIGSLLHPAQAADPIPLQGDLSLDLDYAQAAGSGALNLAVAVRDAGGLLHTVSLGELRPGASTYRADLPSCVAAPCTLEAFTFTPSPLTSAAAGTVTVSGARDSTGDIDLTSAGSDGWRSGATSLLVDIPPVAAVSVDEQERLVTSFDLEGASAAIEVADHPTDLPVFVGSQSVPSDGAVAAPKVGGLDGRAVPARLLGSGVLPRKLEVGTLADLPYALEVMGSGPILLDYQVWLAPDASSSIRAALEEEGFEVIAVDSVEERLSELGRGSAALALRLFLVAAVVALLIAAGTVLAGTYINSRRRAYELAAMRSLGASQRVLVQSGRLEQLALAFIGTVLGAAAGLLGAAVTLPNLLMSTSADHPSPWFGPAWLPVLATIAGVLLLLGLVAEVGARRTARLAQPDLLRAVQE